LLIPQGLRNDGVNFHNMNSRSLVCDAIAPSSLAGSFRIQRKRNLLSQLLAKLVLAFVIVQPFIAGQRGNAGSWYVGNTQAGEWVQYRKVWFSGGAYRFTARAGSPAAGAKIHLEVDGTTLISSVPVPNTGRADEFDYVHLGSRSLTQGTHELRVVFETSSVSLDWFMAVKDADTSTTVKTSDTTMVPPPSDGMIIAPVTAFHTSESNGAASSLLDLGYPIPDANGHPFSDAQALAWWSVPMARDFDCRTDRYWDILVDQFTATRANCPFFYCKGTTDFTDSLQDREYRASTFGGGYEGRWMEKLTEAIGRNPQAAQSMRIGMIWDQGGLGDDFYKIYGYYPKWSTPALVDFSFKYYLAPWLDNVPAWMLFRPMTGRCLIRIMSISPSGVINDGNLGLYLQEIRNRMQLLYGVDPLFTIQHDGPTLNSAALAQIWGRVRGLEWHGPLLTQTAFNGSTWCCTSVGSRHGLDQVWLNDWNPATNTGTPGGNSAGDDAHQPRLDSSGNSNFLTTLAQAQSLNAKVVEEEGFTNLEEGNSIFRSCHPEWQFPNQHMAAMRQFADPASQTLMFEAEGCDTYNKINPVGNSGGSYRREWYSASNLDVYRPVHNVMPWTTKDGGPGNLVSIDAGFFDVWALDSSGVIWGRRITGNPDVWTKVTPPAPQPFSVISVGKAWTWGVTTSGAVYYAHLESGAAHYINQGWNSVSGTMVHVDVGESEVWATNAAGNIYRRPLDGSTGSWTQVSGTMQKVWVGDAFVWGINGGQLYYSLIATPPSTTPISWVSVSNPNNLVQLDVGSDEVWGINASGNVYRKSASNAGSWEAVPGASLSKISVGENYVWGLSGSSAVSCRLEGFRLSEAPEAPLLMRAATAPGQTALSWIPTPGATSYTIKRATTSGGPYTSVGTTSGTTFTNTGLSNGTTYYYVIEATTAEGSSGNSAQFTVQPASAPAAPSGLAASAVSIGQINLTWMDNANNEAGFIIERRLVSSVLWEPLKRIYSPNVTSYSDSTAASGTNYGYRVRAYDNNLTESANSNEAQATTWGGSTIYVNFQPLDAPTPPGYLVDNGQVYGPSNRNNKTYGWTVNSQGQTRLRGLTSDPLLDTVLLWLAGAKWEIAVPNGTYDVKVGIGDGQDNTTSTVNVEGVNYWTNFNLGPGQFVNATHSVTVTDGKITMDQGSGGNNATRLDYVQMTPTSAAQAAPTGLAAVAGNGQVALTWDARSGATSYTVFRTTNPNYVGDTVAGTPTGTSFTDNSVTNGRVYYYTVSAKLAGNGETAKATPVGVLPGVLGSPWVSQSIGGSPGDGAHVAPNTSTPVAYSILAKGRDIWDSSDQFRYVYQPSTGNCSIIAQVTLVQAVDQWTKVGVMIRENLSAGAMNAALAVTPGHGVDFQWRSTTSGASSNTTVSGIGAPRWVKLTRFGNTFTAYQSADGSNWSQVGSPQTINMSTTAYIGLAVTSHEQNTWALGSLSIVTAIPSSSSIPIGKQINLRAQANNQWVSADNAGSSPLIANRATPTAWETFTVADMSATHGPNAIALIAQANGKYVCADNAGSSPLIANRASAGNWETFYWTDNGNGTISLKANANNQWVCADNAGASALIANRAAIAAWESFTVQILP
jgi:fibronectin type 3 domain-containing protein